LTDLAVDLLDTDPDLGEGVADADRQRLNGLLRVRQLTVETGCWEPPRLEPGSLGLLVCEGLMMRRVSFGPASSAELLGPGDILRPAERDLIPEVVPHSTGWRVVAAAKVAVIDRRATAIIGRFPELSAAIAARLVRRSRCLAYLMAAQHFRRVNDALLATLWHIAAMWGKVTVVGVLLPFDLTHTTLAEIVGAQRPTTTVAIHKLEAQGRLRREASGRWVLLGDPPQWDRDAITHSAWAQEPRASNGAS
jgi:CRP-like cAMP-binding protein